VLDVARCAVILLYQFEAQQDEWPQNVKNVCIRFKGWIEEKLGREVGLDDVIPMSRNAKLLEYDLRQAVIADPAFGVALKLVLQMDKKLAVHLQGDQLYDPTLVNEHDPRQPQSPEMQVVIVAAIGVLVLLALFVLCGFITG
jgi:hypothetical protein